MRENFSGLDKNDISKDGFDWFTFLGYSPPDGEVTTGEAWGSWLQHCLQSENREKWKPHLAFLLIAQPIARWHSPQLGWVFSTCVSCDFLCCHVSFSWGDMNKYYPHIPGRVPTTDPRLVCQTAGCIGHTYRMGDPQTATSLDASPWPLVSLIPPPPKGMWWVGCRKLSGQNLKVLMISQSLPNLGGYRLARSDGETCVGSYNHFC